MLLFLDTEFTDFTDCDLISIGLISEDGQHEFYAERTDFNYDWCNDFVRSAVWANLGEFPEAKCKKRQLSERLRKWLVDLPFELTIAYDSSTDWELMLTALDGSAPANIIGFQDLRTVIDDHTFNEAVCKYHEGINQPWHHALHDVRAYRLGWLNLLKVNSAKNV